MKTSFVLLTVIGACLAGCTCDIVEPQNSDWRKDRYAHWDGSACDSGSNLICFNDASNRCYCSHFYQTLHTLPSQSLAGWPASNCYNTGSGWYRQSNDGVALHSSWKLPYRSWGAGQTSLWRTTNCQYYPRVDPAPAVQIYGNETLIVLTGAGFSQAPAENIVTFSGDGAYNTEGIPIECGLHSFLTANQLTCAIIGDFNLTGGDLFVQVEVTTPGEEGRTDHVHVGYVVPDFDECSVPNATFPCHQNASCINVKDTFSCACNEGLTGNGFTECIQNCLSLPASPQNGTLGTCGLLSQVYHGTTCTLECNSGYQLEGTEYNCTAGTLSGSQWCTEIDCVVPSSPAFGDAGTCGSTLEWEESCTFACDDGYFLAGNASWTCDTAVLLGSQTCLQCPTIATCAPGMTRCTTAGDVHCLECKNGTGWSGPLCDDCSATDYFGPTCSAVCTCVGDNECDHGLSGTGTCVSCPILTGWAGANCDICLGDIAHLSGWSNSEDGCDTCSGPFWGPQCMARCSCSSDDQCDTGLSGTGSCSCLAGTGWGGDGCGTCGAGWYGPQCDNVCACNETTGTCSAGLAGNGLCSTCIAGHSGELCQACAPGTYKGTDSPWDIECIECPVRQYAPAEGSLSCLPCASGFITSGPGASSCTPCPIGHYLPDGVISSTCLPCPPGSYVDHEGAVSCSPCPGNTHANTSGTVECAACPGGLWAVEGSSACQDCEAGSFVPPHPAGQPCVPCPAGSFNRRKNQFSCTPCPPGHFNPESDGVTSCQLCPKGSYSSEFNSTTCVDCGDLMTTAAAGSLGVDACLCKLGSYAGRTNRVGVPRPCLECPRGGICNGQSSQPISAAGFFTSKSDALVFVRCENEQVCGQGDTCDVGYEGYRCGVCSPGYYRLDNRCLQCPKNNSWKLYFGAVGLVGFVAALLVLARYRERLLATTSNNAIKSVFTCLGIAITFAQIVATFGTFPLMWPNIVLDILAGFSVFNLNVDLLGSECSVDTAWEDKWKAKLLIFPAVIVVLLLMLAIVILFCKARKSTVMPLTLNNVIAVLVQLASLMFLFNTNASLEYWNCSPQADGTLALDAAPSRQCRDAWWFSLLPWGLSAIAVYLVGVPLLLLLIFARAKKVLFYEDDDEGWQARYLNFTARFGALTAKYRLHSYMWELIIVLRKLGIVLAKTLLTEDPVLQTLAATTVLIASLVLHVRSFPYLGQVENYLEMALVFLTVLLLTFGLGFFSLGRQEMSEIDQELGGRNKAAEVKEAILTVFTVCLLLFSILAVIVAVAWAVLFPEEVEDNVWKPEKEEKEDAGQAEMWVSNNLSHELGSLSSEPDVVYALDEGVVSFDCEERNDDFGNLRQAQAEDTREGEGSASLLELA